MLPVVAVAIEEKSAGVKLRAPSLVEKLKMNMEAMKSQIVMYKLTNIFPFEQRSTRADWLRA